MADSVKKTLKNQHPVDFLLREFLRERSFEKTLLVCAKLSQPF